jgi:hypothetical protein
MSYFVGLVSVAMVVESKVNVIGALLMSANTAHVTKIEVQFEGK